MAAEGVIPADGAGPADEACASCGGPADDLEEVRRVYVTVDGHGRVTGSETMAGRELWCRSCRSLYPHQPADDDGAGTPADGGDPSTSG